MSTEILINSTSTEIRLAVIENGLLQELHFENRLDVEGEPGRSRRVGSIYKGRVQRVLPGMQAAFVDIGLERTAFLHASDMADYPRRIIRAVPEADQSAIQDQLHEGANVVVQVLKDPMGQKGARLTTRLTIPSRYLVLLPDQDNIGVSTRITDEVERQRLENLVAAAADTSRYGYIVRTQAAGVSSELIESDMAYLDSCWKALVDRIASSQPGDCIYAEPSLPLRAVRDWMGPEVERVRVDDAAVAEAMRDFAQEFVPTVEAGIEPYVGEQALFDLYGVDEEIQRAIEPRVKLKSGGSIVIEPTEALTVIDVNTGGFVGKRNHHETIFRTNLEAAEAIGRQLRLRNIGGIIVVDFIDMRADSQQDELLECLGEILARDPARTSMSGVSELGLVELTRKRTTESLAQRLSQSCPTCHGHGRIRRPAAVCAEIQRRLAEGSTDSGELRVVAHPDIVEQLSKMEIADGGSIHFQAEPGFNIEHYEIVPN